MIDIHCHLLPGIDDGASDMAESIALINMAINDGIKRIVITPHLHFGRFDNTLPVIQKVFNELLAEVSKENLDVELAFAAEVRLDSEMLMLLANKNLPLYGEVDGQQYMLLEFPHSHIPVGADKLVSYLKKRNITPVIAHPERNRDLLKSPDKINQFVRMGCWFQVTASSITGGFGESCQQLAFEYIEKGIIQIVASDAHNLKRRPPLLSEAKGIVADKFGIETAQALFIENPTSITQSLFEQVK